MTDAWAVRPGDRLGDFLIERLLGRGSFKSVYAARNLATARNSWPEQVAVCIPHAPPRPTNCCTTRSGWCVRSRTPASSRNTVSKRWREGWVVF